MILQILAWCGAFFIGFVVKGQMNHDFALRIEVNPCVIEITIGKAMYCTGKTYTFRNGAAIDYDGYVADAAQALALIKYYEAKEGNTVTLVEAEGMPDDVYNGVAVTVKIRSNDGSEEYYTAITFKNFQQYTNLTGIMENEGDGYLYVIIVAGNHNEDNSVVLSNDAILAYLDGMDSFALLNPISV